MSFKIIFLFSTIFSINILPQHFSFGIGPGISFLYGNTFYTRDIGLPGYYEINGDYANFRGMNFRSELNLNALASYSFKELPLSVYTRFSFIMMRGRGRAELSPVRILPSIPSNIFGITTQMDILSFSIGGKYIFNAKKLKPLILADVQLNNFSNITINVKNDFREMEYFSTRGMERIGISAGAGVNYSLYSSIDLEFTIKYNIYNLFNKREGEDDLQSININLMFLYSKN